jgi:hypothetical protein
MNKQNQSNPGLSLVRTTRNETNTLVVSAINSVLAGTGQNIGVSKNWLVKHVERLALTKQDVETLVMVRTDFHGSLVHAVKFLYDGLTVDDVYGCYRAQRSLAETEHSASVKKIAMLIRAFAEADPDNESLDEMIIIAHDIIRGRYFWVQYVDQSISILCAIAEKYGCATIDAALAMVESRRAKTTGILPDEEEDDDEDEVDRHRTQYEVAKENLFSQ